MGSDELGTGLGLSVSVTTLGRVEGCPLAIIMGAILGRTVGVTEVGSKVVGSDELSTRLGISVSASAPSVAPSASGVDSSMAMGSEELGTRLGLSVSVMILGCSLANTLEAALGRTVGATEVGSKVVGSDELGTRLGLSVSMILGNGDGCPLVGVSLGTSDAVTVGIVDGRPLGLSDATLLGAALGLTVGSLVGRAVGLGGLHASLNILVVSLVPGPLKAKYTPTTNPIMASIINR